MLRSSEPEISWLEYGCGGGVAAAYAAEAFGKINSFHLLDISHTALEKACTRIKRTPRPNHPVEISKHLMSINNQSLPYPDESIDIANVEGSIYYNSYAGFQRALLDIYRAMKPKGIGRFWFKAEDTRYCIPENEIDLYTYKVNLPGHHEHGMTLCCLPYDCVRKEFSIFSSVMIGKESMCYTSVDTQVGFWVVTVEK